MGLGQDQRWSLTPEAFEGLLARLAPRRDDAALEYERIRRKLLSFFDWRGSTSPEAHADETLDRVARRLQEGEHVEHLGRYVYGVARHVLFEWQRHRAREQAAAASFGEQEAPRESESEDHRRLACLERCLADLPAEDRSLILAYHLLPEGSPVDARKLLAGRLGIPYGTLKTRAHRARNRLEACLRDCLAAGASGTSPGAASHPDGGGRAAMGSEPERDQEMVGYLLGTLSQEIQADIEERYFSDEGYYQELLATADELIHAYLAGTLPDADRRHFESHFLASPWRRERLHFIRDMLAAARHATGASPVPSHPRSPDWFRWGVAAALLLAAAALVAVLLRGSRREIREVDTSPAPSPSSTATPTDGGSPSASPPGPVHTVQLPRRSVGPVELVLAPTVRALQLEVEVEGGRLSYDAVVKRGGRTVWSARELPRTHPEGTVHLSVPTHLLAEGDYVVSVEGEASRDLSPPPRRVVNLRILRERERERERGRQR